MSNSDDYIMVSLTEQEVQAAIAMAAISKVSHFAKEESKLRYSTIQHMNGECKESPNYDHVLVKVHVRI